MKNLKRALALLVVVTMMISSVAFASFSDVTDSSNVANAVNVGVGLNLFKGYEDGTFKPEGDITRAEFAAIVVRAIGQESQASGSATATSFSDVKADHWAAGYINIVTRLGIVNGYGDGTYGPEDKVTYEQAIKMIVVALGYTPAIGSAGYPVGYLTKAGELGITSGVAGSNGVPANRGTVAQLIFNALDVPLMSQDGYGTDISFVINDGVGTGSVRKTIMSEYLDVVKLQVTVLSYEAVTSSTKNDNDVNVNVLNVYKTKYDDRFEIGSDTFDAGTSNVGSLVGSNAFIYVSYDDTSSDTPVVVYAVKDTAKTDEVTIKASDIEFVDDSEDLVVVEYWANDSDKKTTKVTYDVNDVDFYENGALDTTPTDLMDVYGSVTFAKLGKGTADYDTVFITNYTNVVVDTVSERNFKVTSKNASSISFDPDDSAVKSTLYDSKGVEMKWTDLKEDDVISCTIIEGTDAGVVGSKTVTIGTLVNNKITGKITEEDNEEFTIDGKVYETDPAIEGELGLEDEGSFYLDILGNICYYDTTAALNTNYAYVFDASYPETGIDKKTEIKLFTKAGEFVTLKTASKVKLDGTSNVATADLVKNKTTTVTYTSATASTTVVTYGTTAVGTVVTPAGANTADPVVYPYTIATTVAAVDVGQFITYDVNSSNEITKIDRSVTTMQGKTDQEDFSLYATTDSSIYSESSKTLTAGDYSKVYVTDETVIMVAPWALTDPTKEFNEDTNPYLEDVLSTDEDDYELVNVSALADDQPFEVVSLYNVNADREVGAVVVNIPVTIESSTTGIAAVTGKSTGTNTDGDEIVKLKVLQNGEAKSLDSEANFTITAINGTALIPVLNTKGEIKALTTLAVPSDLNNTVTFTAVDGGKVDYTFGRVLDRNRMTLTTTGGDFTVPGTANVSVYDERLSESNRTAVGDITDFDAELNVNVTPNTTTYDNDVQSVYAIAREYDGKIVDVMIYIFKKVN